MHTKIQFYEELALNEWPALQTLFFDGWMLRFAEGYTRRANSINPLYSTHQNIEKKIESCERIYETKKLNPVFKMTTAVFPATLDNILTENGYTVKALTSVQLLELAKVRGMTNPLPASPVRETPLAAWFSDYCRLSEICVQDQSILSLILENIVPRYSLMSLYHEDQAVACGMGILQHKHLGLQNIVTSPQFRNQGFGQQLVGALLGWGKRQGAQTAHLSVMLDNRAALRLYNKFGFEEIYQYWYRLKK